MTRLYRLLLLAATLVCANQIQAQTQMQIEFEKFLDLFPTITWDKLQEATLDDIIIEKTCKQIPYELIRRNMWYEEPQNGPENVYNHIRNEIKSVDYDYTTPPPHIIDVDGDYIHYEKVGGYANVYAVGKMEVSDDITLIVLYNLSTPKEYGKRQLYTFKRSTQQMISAYEPQVTFPNYIFLNDFSFVVFENCGNLEIDDDRTTDFRYTHRKQVKLLSNGYFAEKQIQTGLYRYAGYVQDKDGYANVRRHPNINSEVLYQIEDSSYVFVYGGADDNWFEVSRVVTSNHEFSVDKIGGYIHRSRLKDIDKWRKELRNTNFKE